MRLGSLRPTITSSRPGVKLRPSTIRIPLRTSKARGETPRTVTLVGWPSVARGSAITITSSQDASGWPFGVARDALVDHDHVAVLARHARGQLRASSRAGRTIALSRRPVARSATRKPLDIAISTANTATTSAMPPIGQQRDLPAARARCGRCRRAGAPWSHLPQHVGDARPVGAERRHEAGREAQEQPRRPGRARRPAAAGAARTGRGRPSASLRPGAWVNAHDEAPAAERSPERRRPTSADEQRPRASTSAITWRAREAERLQHRRSPCGARASPCSWCWRSPAGS